MSDVTPADLRANPGYSPKETDMDPYYQDEQVTFHHGDARDVLASLPDNSVDAVVTDPPYGLANTTPAQVAETLSRWTTGDRNYTPAGRGFMGQEWDAFVPPPAVWDECYRVLKPGGHLAVFAGSRTQDLMGISVRLAGFDVRDSLAWLYGSGFSKVGLLGNKKGVKWCECGGNAIPYDHASDTDLPRLRNNVHPSPVPRREGEDPGLLSPMQREAAGRGMEEARAQGPGVVDGGVTGIIPAEDDRRPESSLEGRLVHRTGQGLQDDSQARTPPCEGERVCGGAPTRDGGDNRSPGHAPRGGAPHQPRPGGQSAGEPEAVPGSHVALDDGALRGRAECPRCGGLDPAYRGFSTALKPAHEPILLARKPLEGTVATNVTTWGTGAINIDATRIPSTDSRLAEKYASVQNAGARENSVYGKDARDRAGAEPHAAGRFPANVVLDEYAAHELDQQSGSVGANGDNGQKAKNKFRGVYGDNFQSAPEAPLPRDKGGASRFFKVVEPDPPFMYAAKAPKRERPNIDGVQHPTVKPLALMRWIVRLLTPPGGVVLDPFAGSGTTLLAAVDEDRRAIGVELEERYCEIIAKRLTQGALDLGI